ncbi:diketogulonate reductase-like aldo/keto reductase [Natranaerovirga pectinivora]|uniref:Diketogulonate reductase-like aldo/keto reductase n=1 Tax=Natranaerovirga pectinivora TaxID=682400 RepID=A0A4R3MP90_9FIRM|nr:aldo/keto reductase [Natranaerovirga pectinivora]TCT17041.1 diketogulonate reductase-like aldo/keto reductase [Natranaerovirga pectinivora]
MKSLIDTYELHNGVKIPCVGFGTWQATDGEEATTSVREAIKAGYRHIDTAAAYGNEESIGIAVKESGLKREDIFITSKLQNPAHGYEATMSAFEESMKKLDMDYLDLYLIHWPNPIKFRDCWEEANAGTWKAFEELYEAGRIKAIGVSNFMPHHIDELLKTAKIVPMVNQIRLCPGETQPIVAAYCEKHNILLEAYSPLGTGRIFEVEEMKGLAEKYNKSVAQICIRWCLEMGYLPLPKSVHPTRIKENTEVFDFELSKEDIELIANLKECCGPTRDPDTTNF